MVSPSLNVHIVTPLGKNGITPPNVQNNTSPTWNEGVVSLPLIYIVLLPLHAMAWRKAQYSLKGNGITALNVHSVTPSRGN